MAEEHDLPGFDAKTPSSARIWNYWIGGKDHFAADRAVGDRVREVVPYVAVVARLTRQFLARAVTLLATEYGIRQFLDIGSGLPTADNTHEVAQRVAPSSRIVYVDNDPQVILHSRSLLRSSPEGAVDYLQADLRDVDTILSGAAQTLDFSQPIAILIFQVLHFIPDAEDPYGIVRRLTDAVPPGSFLVVAHGAADIDPEVSGETSQRYNQLAPLNLTLRSSADVARFFTGFELIGPGLVSGAEWLPDIDPGAKTVSFGHHGIARKPG
ncbi:MAG: SAM-dependent methyltransferase [Streptosporangiaceae bacterium]|jgi:O-methyltransferase involved in polyketide biosynthesis